MRVSRAWAASPDTVRGWAYSDYIAALEELGETPIVDAIVYAALCPRKQPDKTFDVTSTAGQRALLQEMENWQ